MFLQQSSPEQMAHDDHSLMLDALMLKRCTVIDEARASYRLRKAATTFCAIRQATELDVATH